MTPIFKNIFQQFSASLFPISCSEEFWQDQALRGDAKQRRRAIEQLTQPACLETVINQSSDVEDVEFARQRWANLLIHQVDIDEFEAEQLVLGCADEERLAYLVNQSENSNLGIMAFYGLRSESVLLDLLRKADSDKLVPAIVAKLQSRQALETALAYINANVSEPKYSELIERKILQLQPAT